MGRIIVSFPVASKATAVPRRRNDIFVYEENAFQAAIVVVLSRCLNDRDHRLVNLLNGFIPEVLLKHAVMIAKDKGKLNFSSSNVMRKSKSLVSLFPSFRITIQSASYLPGISGLLTPILPHWCNIKEQ